MSTFKLSSCKRKHDLINDKTNKFKIVLNKKKGNDYLKFNKLIYQETINSLTKNDNINSFNFVENCNNDKLKNNIEEFIQILDSNDIKLFDFQKEIIYNTVLADKRTFKYDLHEESRPIENGTKLSIIDNPTGSGKTLCSLISAIIYSLEEENNIKNNIQKYFTNKSKWYEINENTKYRNVIFISASQNLVPQWERESLKLKNKLNDFILKKYNKNLEVCHSPTCKLFKKNYNENILLILISKNETGDIHKFLYENENLENIDIEKDNLAFPVFIQDESHLYNSQMFNQVSEINYNLKEKKYPSPLASHFIVLSASISECYKDLFEESLHTTFNYEFNHLSMINSYNYYFLDKNKVLRFDNDYKLKYNEGIFQNYNDCLLNSFIDIKKILPEDEFKYMKLLKFFETNILMRKNIIFILENFSDIISKLLNIFYFTFENKNNSIKYKIKKDIINNLDFNLIQNENEINEFNIFDLNNEELKKTFNGKLIRKKELLKYLCISNFLKYKTKKYRNNTNFNEIAVQIDEARKKFRDEFRETKKKINKIDYDSVVYKKNCEMFNYIKTIEEDKFYLYINEKLNLDNHLIFKLLKILYNNDNSRNKTYYKDQLFTLIKILYLSAHEYNKYFKLALLNSIRCSTTNILPLYQILKDIPITVINMEINSENEKELLALENPIENFNSWKKNIFQSYSIDIPDYYFNREISFQNLIDLAVEQKNQNIIQKNLIKNDKKIKSIQKDFQIDSINKTIERINVGIEVWSKNTYDCQICLEEININKINNLQLCTNCQNIFCSDCLKKWHKQSNSCPNCRGSSKETLFLNHETSSSKKNVDVDVFKNYDLNELSSKLHKGSYENRYYMSTSILGRLEKVFYYFNKYVENTDKKLSFLMICRSNDFEYVFENIISIFKSEKFIFIRYDNKGTLKDSIDKRNNYEKEDLGKVKILLCYDSKNCDTTSGLDFPYIDGIITLGSSSSHEKESQRIGRTLRLSRINLQKTDLLLIKIEPKIKDDNKKLKINDLPLSSRNNNSYFRSLFDLINSANNSTSSSTNDSTSSSTNDFKELLENIPSINGSISNSTSRSTNDVSSLFLNPGNDLNHILFGQVKYPTSSNSSTNYFDKLDSKSSGKKTNDLMDELFDENNLNSTSSSSSTSNYLNKFNSKSSGKKTNDLMDELFGENNLNSTSSSSSTSKELYSFTGCSVGKKEKDKSNDSFDLNKFLNSESDDYLDILDPFNDINSISKKSESYKTQKSCKTNNYLKDINSDNSIDNILNLSSANMDIFDNIDLTNDCKSINSRMDNSDKEKLSKNALNEISSSNKYISNDNIFNFNNSCNTNNSHFNRSKSFKDNKEIISLIDDDDDDNDKN
jgi:hypothetical protein